MYLRQNATQELLGDLRTVSQSTVSWIVTVLVPLADKGYQGCDEECPGCTVATPRKTPRGGELSKSDEASNAAISALRAPVERLIAHFKSWRIFHTELSSPVPHLPRRLRCCSRTVLLLNYLGF